MSNQSISTNTFGVAKWVVSADATQGTHTTISAATTSASAGDTIFIRDGTFTENVALKTGVSYVALNPFSTNSVGNTIISGKCSYSGSGSVKIEGITLQTNSDFAISITGNSVSIVELTNCYISGTNNIPIQCTSSNTSANLSLYYSDITCSGAGLAFFTGLTCQINLFYCNMTCDNTAVSTATTGGFIGMNYTACTGAFATSGSATYYVENSTYLCGNNPLFAQTGTSNGGINWSRATTGSAAAITLAAGAATAPVYSALNSNSASTHFITGSGTVNYAYIVNGGSAQTFDGALTITPYATH